MEAPHPGLHLVKGSILDIDLKKKENLIVVHTHASGLGNSGIINSFVNIYPYADPTKGRQKVAGAREYYATPETRGTLGDVNIIKPPSSDPENPHIAVLIGQYTESSRHVTRTVFPFNRNHPDHEHQKLSLADTEIRRVHNFRLCMNRLYALLVKRPANSPIKTVVVPYLSGNCRLSEWNRTYMNVVKSFSRNLFNVTGIRTVILVKKNTYYTMIENPDLDDKCSFSDVTRYIPKADNMPSYEASIVADESDECEMNAFEEKILNEGYERAPMGRSKSLPSLVSNLPEFKKEGELGQTASPQIGGVDNASSKSLNASKKRHGEDKDVPPPKKSCRRKRDQQSGKGGEGELQPQELPQEHEQLHLQEAQSQKEVQSQNQPWHNLLSYDPYTAAAMYDVSLDQLTQFM